MPGNSFTLQWPQKGFHFSLITPYLWPFSPPVESYTLTFLYLAQPIISYNLIRVVWPLWEGCVMRGKQQGLDCQSHNFITVHKTQSW